MKLLLSSVVLLRPKAIQTLGVRVLPPIPRRQETRPALLESRDVGDHDANASSVAEQKMSIPTISGV